MDTNTNTSTSTGNGTEHLPTTIQAFNEAHEARDADRALAQLTSQAVISDVGESFSGEESLRHFITDAGAEFGYTDDITAVTRDGGVWVVSHHLEGDFPGGKADLDYRFALDGDRIARVDIVVA